MMEPLIVAAALIVRFPVTVLLLLQVKVTAPLIVKLSMELPVSMLIVPVPFNSKVPDDNVASPDGNVTAPETVSLFPDKLMVPVPPPSIEMDRHAASALRTQSPQGWAESKITSSDDVGEEDPGNPSLESDQFSSLNQSSSWPISP
jgi:hypothetical protein